MKSTLKLAFLGALLSAAAQAQTAAPQAPATEPADAAPNTVVQAPNHKGPDHHCLRDTGSRIPRNNKNACMGDPGRTYTHEDIARTGAIDVADALQKLDPSITVHR